MPRKSLAEKYYAETRETLEETGNWIVLYDFKGMKPSTNFWSNLKRLSKYEGEGSLQQYSVFNTNNKRKALTAMKLAKHYGGETEVYKVLKIEE